MSTSLSTCKLYGSLISQYNASVCINLNYTDRISSRFIVNYHRPTETFTSLEFCSIFQQVNNLQQVDTNLNIFRLLLLLLCRVRRGTVPLCVQRYDIVILDSGNRINCDVLKALRVCLYNNEDWKRWRYSNIR